MMDGDFVDKMLRSVWDDAKPQSEQEREHYTWLENARLAPWLRTMKPNEKLVSIIMALTQTNIPQDVVIKGYGEKAVADAIKIMAVVKDRNASMNYYYGPQSAALFGSEKTKTDLMRTIEHSIYENTNAQDVRYIFVVGNKGQCDTFVSNVFHLPSRPDMAPPVIFPTHPLLSTAKTAFPPHAAILKAPGVLKTSDIHTIVIGRMSKAPTQSVSTCLKSFASNYVSLRNLILVCETEPDPALIELLHADLYTGLTHEKDSSKTRENSNMPSDKEHKNLASEYGLDLSSDSDSGAESDIENKPSFPDVFAEETDVFDFENDREHKFNDEDKIPTAVCAEQNREPRIKSIIIAKPAATKNTTISPAHGSPKRKEKRKDKRGYHRAGKKRIKSTQDNVPPHGETEMGPVTTKKRKVHFMH